MQFHSFSRLRLRVEETVSAPASRQRSFGFQGTSSIFSSQGKIYPSQPASPEEGSNYSNFRIAHIRWFVWKIACIYLRATRLHCTSISLRLNTLDGHGIVIRIETRHLSSDTERRWNTQFCFWSDFTNGRLFYFSSPIQRFCSAFFRLKNLFFYRISSDLVDQINRCHYFAGLECVDLT